MLNNREAGGPNPELWSFMATGSDDGDRWIPFHDRCCSTREFKRRERFNQDPMVLSRVIRLSLLQLPGIL